MTLVFNFVKS